ncbi:MAG: hypothetical protein ACT4OU_01580 [Hyphomicrobium sp.]
MIHPSSIRSLALSLGFSFALTAGALAQTPPPQAPSSPSAAASAQPPPVPPAEILLLLVRNAFAALNQANQTGNYTVLHALGSPTLQAQNSPAKLGIVFTDLREKGVDLAPTLVLTPQLTESPAVSANGELRLGGYFPTAPLQIDFTIVYRWVEARWRIDGMAVAAKPSPATAPPPAPAAAKPAEKATPADAAQKK